MKNKILFLAPFPNERYGMDGMISRIKAIDEHFVYEDRCYLYVSIRKNLKSYYAIHNNVEVYELNLFFHFFKIISILFSAESIYSHSIYMIRNIWFLMPFYQGKIVLDIHGVVPEEVRFFGGNRVSYIFMSLVEKIIFRKKNIIVVCVTNAMCNHFKKKYKKFKGKFLVFSIFPEHLIETASKIEGDNLKTDDNSITVLYSGGNALWQKVDLMLSVIEKNQAANIKYIILTKDIQEFRNKIEKRTINLDNLLLKSVSPHELSEYYKKADYGFILRDDNVVNKVANPTKLVEYLFYGIIPIVTSPSIGDYLDYGYEYLKLDDYNTMIAKPINKSYVNIAVAKKLLHSNKEINFKQNVFESN